MIFHNSGKGLAALAATLVVGFAVAKPVHATTYSVVDLGTVGGSNSVSTAINSLNQIAGFSDLPGGCYEEAISYVGGTTNKLGFAPYSNSSYAYGINSSGLVVGQSGTFAAKFQNGAATSLGSLGGSKSVAYGVNDNGVIVGQSQAANAFMRAFIAYPGQKMTDLGTLGGSQAYATAINNNNAVVGYSYVSGNSAIHGFYYLNGSIMNIPALGSGIIARATGVNNNGRVVGYSCTVSNVASSSHAFTWAPGSPVVDLGTLNGAGYSFAYGVNDNYVVVGQSNGHGVVWTSGQIHDLNSMLSVSNGFTIQKANAINNNGFIAATGLKNNVVHAVLLIPAG